MQRPAKRLKSKEVAVAACSQVAILFTKNATDSANTSISEKDLPVRPNDTEATLMSSDYYLTENRWKSNNQIVNYRLIHHFDEPIYMQLAFLSRVKIYALSLVVQPAAQAELLRFLSRYTPLRELEIDELELLHDSNSLKLRFNKLELLSIDAIEEVTEAGEPVENENTAIRLEVPKLNSLYSGEYSV